MFNTSMFSSKEHTWETPGWLFEILRQTIDFTVDAAASAENAKLPKFWTAEDDGLAQDWSKELVWVNPPYGRVLPKWIQKAHMHWLWGGQSVVLVPARPDTSYWQEYVLPHKGVMLLFLKGRLQFELQGKRFGSANFPSALIFFLHDETLREKIKEKLGHLGSFR